MPIRKLASLLLLVPILLAACSAATQTSDFQGGGAQPPVFEEPPAPEGDFARDSSANFAPQSAEAVDRLVIKNANMTIVIPDPTVSMSTIAQMAEEMGGFVVSSNLYYTTLESGEEVPRGLVTVRVPSDRFNEAIAQIESGATEVRAKDESGQDVTQEYVDLESRLRNLEAAEAQLAIIMEDANRTEDVINVFNQLTQVRGEIEVIKGQMQYLEQSAAYSAITVDLIADAALQPLSIGGWQPGGVAKNAIQALINTLQFIANAAIWLALYVLPVLLVLAIPVVLVVWFFRRRRRRKAAQQPSE